jgi:2-phosphosulfolactate phosphatase
MQRLRPGWLVVGEGGGLDFDNSPGALLATDLRGRGVILFSGSGTVAVQRCAGGEPLWLASLVCARATARSIRARTDEVTLVVSGTHCGWDGDEDRACADLIRAELLGRPIDDEDIAARVERSVPAQNLVNPEHPEFAPDDLTLCTAIDRFAYALEVRRRDGGLWVERAGLR